MADAPYEYVSGDLNLLSLGLNVQYRVLDPYVYHYRTANAQEVIEDVVRDHVRDFVSSKNLEQLLNVHRKALEERIGDLFDNAGGQHAQVFAGVELVKANLLAIGPVTGALNSFREVSSAQEDRERLIVNAQRYVVSLIPQAHGNAEYELEQAKGEAYRKVAAAGAEAGAISMVAAAVRTAPDVLRNMLWREKLETALSGNPKIIVPNQGSLDKVALWKRRTPAPGAGVRHHGNGREGR